MLNNDSIETAIAYLTKSFESKDPEVITSAIGNILKAKRLMVKLAKKANISRASLYKSLSGKTNPSFGTILKLLCELGIGLRPYQFPSKYKKAGQK